MNPGVRLKPELLRFGIVQVGTTSPAQTVTLTNTGPTYLHLPKLTISDNYAFAPGTTCSDGITLKPKASCVMNVTFTPTKKGRYIGAVTIHDDSPGRKQEVPLSGVGLGD
jgi:hypothetical protein